MPPSTTTVAPTTTAAPISGRSIFRANCAVCHGENGEGGYGANLQLSSLSLGQIIETVTYGRGAMEPWVDTLAPEEIEAVARYVRRLQTGEAP
jgi:mono/diheme cytochrome c family protein